MGTPTINIGDRQKGRMMGESIISCEPKCDRIIESINEALKDSFQEKMRDIKSLYGDGTASDQIIDNILDYLKSKRQTSEKHFYDINFLLGKDLR